jgi:hypothetical protein
MLHSTTTARQHSLDRTECGRADHTLQQPLILLAIQIQGRTLSPQSLDHGHTFVQQAGRSLPEKHRSRRCTRMTRPGDSTPCTYFFWINSACTVLDAG